VTREDVIKTLFGGMSMAVGKLEVGNNKQGVGAGNLQGGRVEI